VKSVRYAVAALGVPSALALGMPAANAAAAATHVPKKPAKTVSLRHDAAPNGVRLTCGSTEHKTGKNRGGNWVQKTFYGGTSCVHSVVGVLSVSARSLDMRTRVYSKPGGTRVFQNFVGGTIGNGVTAFSTNVNIHGRQICAALVDAHDHSIVEVSAACVSL
jgi:hypothetical protein